MSHREKGGRGSETVYAAAKSYREPLLYPKSLRGRPGL